ncbi:MAG: hypothetical protein EBW83_07330, partial [Rhodobacterales bacterium]|nr:hypothetical protein [Rhodobacterales bacterium]
MLLKDGVFAGERVQSVNIRGSHEDRMKVFRDFQKAEVPADVEMIEGWLAELSVITAKRVDDDFTESLRL